MSDVTTETLNRPAAAPAGAEPGPAPEPVILAHAEWKGRRASVRLTLEQATSADEAALRVVERHREELGSSTSVWYSGGDLRAAAREFETQLDWLSREPRGHGDPAQGDGPYEERTLVRLDHDRLDALLARLPDAGLRFAPPAEPTWPTRRSEPPALSPQAAAVLQSMREQVRAASAYRTRILAAHPAPVTQFDLPPSPEAARAAERMEARLAALEGPAPERGAALPEAPPAEPLSAAPREVQPAVVERMESVVHAHALAAYQAEEAVRARVRLIAPGAEQGVAAAVRAPGVDSGEAAASAARAALGKRGLRAERDQVAALATTAWEARSRLDRLNQRAAEVLEMRRDRPGAALPPEARVDVHEVLREVERRRDELARADLERRALTDPSVLPAGEPRMQPGAKYQDNRSVDCLRCGTTAGREDGRSRLHTDGTPKLDADRRPERFAPRDGELCTPCWLNGAPMSVPELKLAQRQARSLEAAQVRFRPGRAGWDERAREWTVRERARRGMTEIVDERLDAPSPWVVQPSPAELGDRRMEALIEREALREEALEKGQWDLPQGSEAAWWDLKFSGMEGGEPEARPEPSPEARLRLETERLAEARRRLLAVVGVEDSALRRVLETQAAVRLHLAQGSAVREAWERTRGIPRAEARATAREEVRQRFLAPETVAHHRRLREARGLVLPESMPAPMQAAIRARQVERVLADLDVPTLVRRTREVALTASSPDTARAAAEFLAGLRPALADPRLRGHLAAAQLAETARQDRDVFHSGVDEAVLPGERRAEAHERSIDRWLNAGGAGRLRAEPAAPPDAPSASPDAAPAAGDARPGAPVRTARDLARHAGELNPRREVKEYTPSKADGTLPWQLAERDAAIAAEVAGTGYTAPERILAALEQYRADVAVRGMEIGDPFGEDVRERLIEAAARQSGFTQGEVDRLWELHELTAAAEDPHAFDQLMQEAGAWMADPDRNNDPARLRDALELRTRGGARLSFSAADLDLLARAERAAAPYLDVFDEYRAAWQARDAAAGRGAEHQALVDAAAHPAVREAVRAHADPRVAEFAGQLAAVREFERIDPAYQEAMRQIERAGSILETCGETRQAAQQAWTELEQTVREQFSNPEKLLERLRKMDGPEVGQLAGELRTNPLALSANHPRTGRAPRIPGVNAAGVAERLEPRLKTVRAQGLRGLMGEADRSATEHQARVAAVALETWAEARQRGDEARAWAAGQLALPSDTPLAKVTEAARARLVELKETHQELIGVWKQLTPAPTRAQIERRLKALDPETAALARSALPELAPAPRPAAPAPARRPEFALSR
jgi:hypothetical protein